MDLLHVGYLKIRAWYFEVNTRLLKIKLSINSQPFTEKERISALQSYNVLDTLPESDFDDITRIASEICQTPVSFVTFVDEDRQWFKSSHGLDVASKDIPREHSFCSVAIQTPTEPLIVKDLREDTRFDHNPFVAGAPNVVFYAGIPLVTPEGHALGSLCVLDNEPKEFGAEQIKTLKALANVVVAQLELRKKVTQLNQSQQTLEGANRDLEDFAHIVSHDIKSPLRLMYTFSTFVQMKCAGKLVNDELQMLGFIHDSASRLFTLVDGILDFSKFRNGITKKTEIIDLQVLIAETIKLLSLPANITFKYPEHLPKIKTSKAGLQQVLLNVVGNAIKYNDKAQGIVELDFKQEGQYYQFQISDNGPGIERDYHERIFKMMETLGKKDRLGQIGSGIGLASVKRIIEKLNGDIKITSEIGKGATFEFRIPAPEPQIEVPTLIQEFSI